MIDCRLCMCHTVMANCTKYAHTGKRGEIASMKRCVIHNKAYTRCPYYWESEDLIEYYKQHPLSDLP